jgi:N-acetylneuraminate synthase
VSTMRIAGKPVGAGYPCYVVAELGANHQGDLEHCKRLIQAAAEARVDMIKLQKRTLDICIPPEQRDVPKETPWGTMSYLEYRKRLEFDEPDQWRELIAECDAYGIAWCASSWDIPALAFIEALDPPTHKIASASITDAPLLRAFGATGKPLIMSTGMSTTMQVIMAVGAIKAGTPRITESYEPGLALLHCNSSYPCEPRDCNLAAMANLRGIAGPVGWSGHERGLQISLAATVLGASIIERHLTLDRTQWGTDHAASLEPKGMAQLVRDIRIVEEAMGDGVKRVTASEEPIMKKLRRVM